MKSLLKKLGIIHEPQEHSEARFRCSFCGRMIEEGLMPSERIGEWYNDPFWRNWIQGEDLLLKCQKCNRVYCSDCVPRFWQVVEILPVKKCKCGERDFVLIPGRQCDSKL